MGFSVPDRHCVCKGKRESGGNPERSGHCKQGAKPRNMPLHESVRRRRSSDDLQARKPAENVGE